MKMEKSEKTVDPKITQNRPNTKTAYHKSAKKSYDTLSLV